MRGETQERWRELCAEVIVEQDPDKFLTTIQELLQLLEDREEGRRHATALRTPLQEKPSQFSCAVRLNSTSVGLA